VLVFEMKRKVRLSIDCSLSGSQRGGEEFQRLAFNLQPSRRAFTIIELVGVLAIIAIIAAALAPNIIKRIDRAALQREISDLSTMGNGLVRTILTDRVIPTTNGISDAIAKYLDLSPNQVKLTPRGFRRAFMVDPNLDIGGNNLRNIPYAQNNAGIPAPPANARVMILSTIGGPEVTTITNTFAQIWNTSAGGKPTGWGGKADDFCIQRVDLGGLFHKLYLLNVDGNPFHNGYYAIDPNAPDVPVSPKGSNAVIYLLKSTAVSLFAGGSDPANLQMRLIVRQDESYVYQHDRWSGNLLDEPAFDMPPGSFGWWVDSFLKHPYRGENGDPSTKFGSTQRAVIDEFYTYLWSYWSWSHAPRTPLGFFAGQEDNPSVLNPFFRTVINSQNEVSAYTENIIQNE
jgi:type II secretory pathway pseudopilin PulG